MTAVADDPRYPVGRFEPPSHADASQIRAGRNELAGLPSRLRQAVAGLSEAQLDTPYRDGGWTVRQLVHHIADSHFNAYCRFKLALTESNPVIKPYDETAWAELPDSRTVAADVSLSVIDGLHARWIALIDALSDDDWQRTFHHPERNRDVPLWWNLELYAWHCRHHVAHIMALRSRKQW